jgi:hypothetical protein
MESTPTNTTIINGMHPTRNCDRYSYFDIAKMVYENSIIQKESSNWTAGDWESFAKWIFDTEWNGHHIQ